MSNSPIHPPAHLSVSELPCQTRVMIWFHDNSSTDISSTTLRLHSTDISSTDISSTTVYQDFTSVQDSNTSNFCFSKSLFSSIPTSTYTMIPVYQSHFH